VKNILVTGGAGFIGSTLTKELLKQGNQVTVIDNFSDFYDVNVKERNILPFLKNPKFRLIRLDITNLEDLFNKVGKHDVIVHLAAKAGVRPSIDDPIGYEEVNVKGTINLLEFAKHHNIKQFVFASSSSVYGTNPEVPWIEDSKIEYIISPYAGTKRSAEIQGQIYSHLYGIRFIALRLFTVFGPKQRPDLAIHKFAKLILRNQPIVLFGNGSTLRDYTFVDDIVGAFITAISYDQSMYEIINIGNNKPISLIDLVRALEEVFEVKAKLVFEEEQPGDVPVTYANIEKAKELLNYSPKTSVKEGLLHFKTWIQNNHSQ
jgi:UDP-glucuronate 4-epimerase